MNDKTRATGAALATYVVARDAYYAASNAAHRTYREAAVKQEDLAAARAAYDATPSAAHRADLRAARIAAVCAEQVAEIRRAACAAAEIAYATAIEG